MGETSGRVVSAQIQASQFITVDTLSGRIHIQWDWSAIASPEA